MSTDQHTSSVDETEQQTHRTVADLDAETMVWRASCTAAPVVHTDGDCRHVAPTHRQIKCQKLQPDLRVCKECNRQHRQETRLTREWLYQEYIEAERTQEEIAEERGVSRKIIRRRLEEVGIETRPGGSHPPDGKLRNETWMRVEYIDRNKTIHDIAEAIDCSHTTVWRWLKRHGIKTRTVSRTPDDRLEDVEWLRARYHGDGLTLAEIAEVCDCCTRTVRKRMSEHDIETRQPGPGRGGSQ